MLLPVFLGLGAVVLDIGNWYVHKRHLQLQADAGALAGGGSFTFPCANDTIVERARTYAGDPSSASPYNTQIPPTEDANVHVLVARPGWVRTKMTAGDRPKPLATDKATSTRFSRATRGT